MEQKTQKALMISRPQTLREDVSELKRRLHKTRSKNAPRHTVTEFMRVTQDVHIGPQPQKWRQVIASDPLHLF